MTTASNTNDSVDFIGNLYEIIDAIHKNYDGTDKAGDIPAVQTLYKWRSRGIIEPVPVPQLKKEVYQYSTIERLIFDGMAFIKADAKAKIMKLQAAVAEHESVENDDGTYIKPTGSTTTPSHATNP